MKETDRITDLTHAVMTLAGSNAALIEAVKVLINPPPTAIQMTIRLENATQAARDLRLALAVPDVELEAFGQGIEKTMQQLRSAMLAAQFRGAPNMPKGLGG